MNLSLLNAITAKLKYLSQNQQTIAQNVANADTPGYRAKVVAAPDFRAMLGRAGEVTGGRGGISVRVPRIGTATETASGVRVRDAARASEVKPDGNNVTIEEELLTMAQVQMDYAAMTNLYRKQTGLLKIALGRGGN